MVRIGVCAGKTDTQLVEEACRRLGKRMRVRLTVQKWEDVKELEERIRGGMEFDILFLNLASGDQEMINLGRCLREELRNFQTQLIYLAEKECYSRPLIQTIPLDFYIEGSGVDRMEEILQRALIVLRRAEQRFEFKFRKNYYSIPFRDIVYLCSDVRRIRVKTALEEFEFNGLLRDVKNLLPKDFLVIHKSFIINKAHVLRYDFETVRLSDGTTLSISKTNRSMVKSCLRVESNL